MIQANQILTYIKTKTEQAEEITLTKQEVISIFEELLNEMRILEDRPNHCNEHQPIGSI